jgi:uncharacterized protein YchJ
MTFIVLILFLSLFNKFAVSFLLFSKSVICEKATASPTSLSAGFGAKPKTEKDQNSDFNAVRPQIKSLKGSDNCPCRSGLNYKECCLKFHRGGGEHEHVHVLPSSVKESVRARFSAYATGEVSYLIESTHPKHRDYTRHMGATLNPTKARKIWMKELLQQNSEVFEFLKLEILDEIVDVNITKKEIAINLEKGIETELISFRVLVRHRSDRTIIPFQETALFVKIKSDDELEHPLSQNILNKKNKLNYSYNNNNHQLYPLYLYAKGIITVMDEKTTQRLINEAPKYMSNSIRDQW